MRKELVVESIRVDGDTQSRERINEDVVAEYAEVLLRQGDEGHVMPPVTVYYDGTDYWLADGFHRLLAAKQIGRESVVAEVTDGTREEAAWAACGANRTHGLRRTNADKRRAVEMALKLRPEMSAHAISDHCGVGNDMVRDVRVRCRIPTPERVKGKDGKTYPTPPPRSDRTTVRSVGPPPAANERSGPAPVPPPSPTKRRAGPVDDIGRSIPEELFALWDRRQEVQDMLTALSRIRVAIRTAQETRDPLFSEIPFSSALAHLDQAYDAVQVAKPYAVCAFCQGHGCKACGQRGLLSKFRWETTVPREHKEAVMRQVEKS